MPIRNLWSLECGEVITAEALLKNIKGCEVYFPVRDVGIDLLVVKDKKPVSIQVKESRYYQRKHSWHCISRKKFLGKEIVDFYVFLTYFPKYDKNKMKKFENKFLIVPTSDLELEKLLKNKKIDKRGRYSFYFNFEGNKVTEKREPPPTDYSEYLDRWDLVKDKIEILE